MPMVRKMRYPIQGDAILTKDILELLYKGPSVVCENHISDCKSLQSAKDYLQTSDLTRKYVEKHSSSSTANAAIDTFLECEDLCLTMNASLLVSRPWFIDRCRSFIKRVLGDFNKSEMHDAVRFTNGASARLARKHSNISRKVINIEVTARAYNYMNDFIRRYHYCDDEKYSWASIATIEATEHSVITTVPKNKDTDRPIEKSASFNMGCQLAIGSMIRKRLNRFGVDINDQEINKDLCRTSASSIATIDLKSASDNICSRLVEMLLPLDWYQACDKFRHHSSLLPNGNVIELSKFSAMGNGFTFELETLIFTSIVYASSLLDFDEFRCCSKERWHVFGDDIIVPKTWYLRCVSALEQCGFTINDDKSFCEGPFKESCGVNIYHGVDITPVRLKREIKLSEELIQFYNLTYLYDLNHLPWSKPVFSAVRRWIRLQLRKRGHEYYGPISDNNGNWLFNTANTRYVSKFDPNIHQMKFLGIVRSTKARALQGVGPMLGQHLITARTSLSDEFASKHPSSVSKGKLKKKYLQALTTQP